MNDEQSINDELEVPYLYVTIREYSGGEWRGWARPAVDEDGTEGYELQPAAVFSPDAWIVFIPDEDVIGIKAEIPFVPLKDRSL